MIPTLISIELELDGRYWEKYDIFTLGNTKWVCIERPYKKENGTWYIKAKALENTQPVYQGNALPSYFDDLPTDIKNIIKNNNTNSK